LLQKEERLIYDDFCSKHLYIDFANIISIGIANFLYAGYFEQSCSKITWKWFWRFQFYTFAIGAIISIVTYWVVRSIKLKQQLKEVESINATLHQQLLQIKPKETFVFESETRNEKLIIQSNDLICIKAEGNYSMFYYIDSDKTNSKLLRLSLKSAETIVESNTSFSRSHRSYVVNCTKIVKINSIGSNYQIWVHGLAEPLPASRQNIADLKQNIEKGE
jgi:DNA-binding LytR/AlgR family response regulator